MNKLFEIGCHENMYCRKNMHVFQKCTEGVWNLNHKNRCVKFKSQKYLRGCEYLFMPLLELLSDAQNISHYTVNCKVHFSIMFFCFTSQETRIFMNQCWLGLGTVAQYYSCPTIKHLFLTVTIFFIIILKKLLYMNNKKKKLIMIQTQFCLQVLNNSNIIFSPFMGRGKTTRSWDYSQWHKMKCF